MSLDLEGDFAPKLKLNPPEPLFPGELPAPNKEKPELKESLLDAAWFLAKNPPGELDDMKLDSLGLGDAASGPNEKFCWGLAAPAR